MASRCGVLVPDSDPCEDALAPVPVLPSPSPPSPALIRVERRPARSRGREANHIIVDMRFNQVLRAEPGAGECGPVSLNTKQAWDQGSENGKVIFSSVGGPESRGHGGPSQPLLWNCWAVTSAWRMHLGHVCGSWPHSGLGNWGSDGQVGLRPQVKPPLPSTSSAQTFPGCPSQHQHPGTLMADLALTLHTPFSSLCASHATSPAGTKGRRFRIPGSSEPAPSPHLWPRPRVCPRHLSRDSSNHKPLRGLCPPHGTLSPCPS